MSDYYQTCAIPKPELRATTKRREKKTHADHVATIRVYVFGRERGLCRICRIRRATMPPLESWITTNDTSR